MAPRRVPTRSCVACRTSRPKGDLVRIVRTTGGFVGFDPTGRTSGRGAYLCRDGSCWNLAIRRAGLEKALRIRILPELKNALSMGPEAVFATPDLLGLRADILIAPSPRLTNPIGSSSGLHAFDNEGGARGQE